MENDEINVLLDVQVSEDDDISLFEDLDCIISGKVSDALSKYSFIQKSISDANIEVVSVEVDMRNYTIKADISFTNEQDSEIIRAFLTWNINY